MSRLVGTVSRGIRAPIIREGDDLAQIVTKCILEASVDPDWGFKVRDKDVIAMTEAIAARAQGNYATVDDIAQDVKNKLGGETVGVVFPITSRNRFAVCLRGIARGAKKVIIQLSYPSDEVGNKLIDPDIVEMKGVDPYKDVLSLERYRELFGYNKHRFTGMDYIQYYEDVVREAGADCEIVFANNPRVIMDYTQNILCCDIHTLAHTKRVLKEAGAKNVVGIDEILNAPVNGSGYNEDFGLLGTNKASEDTVKLFPRGCQELVNKIQKNIKDATGKTVEVMIYGDGAFKDPVGEIWEFADPVVAPFFTEGLIGTPNELKIKYLADNNFADLKGEELKNAIKGEIEKKDANLVGKMASEGTTPRQLTDLIGSLCDLTSGSGDKGTPIVYIQGYFDNYTTE